MVLTLMDYQIVNGYGSSGSDGGTLSIGRKADGNAQTYPVDFDDDTNLLTDVRFQKAIVEKAYNCTGTVLDPSNGTLQYKTLSANTTFTESFVDGESITLMMIDDGSAYTVTWPTITHLVAPRCGDSWLHDNRAVAQRKPVRRGGKLMLSRKILSASQSGGSGGGGGGGGNSAETGQANGVAVSNTLLPSTVVCYTHGVSDTFNATSIDGWYRATSGNLYESSSLFSAEGSGTGAYGKGTTYGHATAYGLNSGYFTSLGYSHSNGDYSLITFQPVFNNNGSVQDQRWQCNWVRDYLPDHLDSNTDSLCIEMFVNPIYNYESYSRLVSASGWQVDAPAGFELNYNGSAQTTMEMSHTGAMAVPIE